MKDETTETIEKLNSANISSIMITGDNLLTAISVGEKCKICPDKNHVIIPDVTTGQLKWRIGNSHLTNTQIDLTAETTADFAIALTGEEQGCICASVVELKNGHMRKNMFRYT